MTTLQDPVRIGRKSQAWLDSVLDILRAFADRKLLKLNNGDLEIFLNENLHYFFHEYHSYRNIKCCKCSPNTVSISRSISPHINRMSFSQLYRSSGEVIAGHEVKEHGTLVQNCLHQFKSNKIQLDELDIDTLCFFLSRKGNLTYKEYTAVHTIKESMTKVYVNIHEDKYIKHYDELEKALAEMIDSKYIRRIVLRLFKEIPKDSEVLHQLTNQPAAFDEPVLDIAIGDMTYQYQTKVYAQLPSIDYQRQTHSDGTCLRDAVSAEIKHEMSTSFEYKYGQRSQKPYPALFLCDEMFVDCIVSKELEHKKTDVITDIEQIQSTDAFKKLLSLQNIVQNNGDMTEDTIKICLQTAVTLDEDLACRYILCQSESRMMDVNILHHQLQYARRLKHKNCAKAIAWEITRRFASTVSITQYYDIWPGFKCICKTNYCLGNAFCSASTSNLVLIAEVHKDKTVNPRFDSFHGMPIIYKEVNGQSEEAKWIVEQDYLQIDNLPLREIKGVSSEDAMKYFTKHSKLSMFSKSRLKSKKFGHETHSYKIVPCIQLFCRAKGFIPIGESHFPEKIGAIQTDILEGYPQLNAKKIQIGTALLVPTKHKKSREHNLNANDQIGQATSNYQHAGMDIDTEEDTQFYGQQGTIGGFIKYHGDEAFLTCAHVILDHDCLVLGSNRNEIHENPVKVYCKDGDSLRNLVQCGQLACFAFPPDLGMGSSVDAAIIKIDQHFASSYLDATQQKEMKSQYLHKCCLDWRELGVHTNLEVHALGSVTSPQHINDATKILQKQHNVEFETSYQAFTDEYNKIKPADMPDEVHLVDQAAKTASDRQSKNPKNSIFLNQIAMHKLKFEQGDSGMCIYVRNSHDNDGKLWCIGMAIATHPAGGCVITPLNAILDHFNYE